MLTTTNHLGNTVYSVYNQDGECIGMFKNKEKAEKLERGEKVEFNQEEYEQEWAEEIAQSTTDTGEKFNVL